MAGPGAVAHALALPGGGELRPLGEPDRRIAARVSSGADIPDGAAWPEAVAARLEASGATVSWEAPVVPESARALERLSYRRGKASLDVLRADPSLLTGIQAGTWFSAAWHARLLRRLLVWAPVAATAARAVTRREAATRLSADVWFWAGVRSRASRREWRRLTRSSYVAFCYHQLAGAAAVSVHDLDLAPARFEAHLRMLRRLGYQPLSLGELYAFHSEPDAVLPRRRYLLTSDDGYSEAVAVLAHHAETRPVVFVITRFASGEQTPDPETSFAGWPDLAAARAAGVEIGSHTRTHASLVDCADDALADEISGPLDDFEAAGIDDAPVLAYPFGHFDDRVRQAAVDAGYRLAYTTRIGRNGAGTDPWRLRRITIHGRDGALALAWKAVTAEPLPGVLARRQSRRSAA